MSRVDAKIAMQFDDTEQQRAASALGMWVFLATEVLFFGGLFVAYTVYRFEYPDVFPAASRHLNLWVGGAMTAILLIGSLLVAMSDHLMEHGRECDARDLRQTIWKRLAITAALGVAFLSLEFYEYYSLFSERLFPGPHFNGSSFAHLDLGGRSGQLFFVLFFCMTGLHALHMVIGVSLVSALGFAVRRSNDPFQLRNPLMVIGLYWHFVDVIWIFLYPLFYLVR